MMEQKYIKQDESIYDWDDATAWCFENLGVLAHGDEAVVHDRSTYILSVHFTPPIHKLVLNVN